MSRALWITIVSLSTATFAYGAHPAAPHGGREAIPVRSADPYRGAIVLDAASGKVLFEDHADATGYPASVIKLMDLLLIQERIEAGTLSLSNTVTITAESASVGGSQVYLAEKEVFPIEELLFALAVHSANDAAVALATYVAGTKEAFVELMNARAAQLGMTSTRFGSVHGLPPAKDQTSDVSTARDLSRLALELLRHPTVLRYTSVQNRPFRNGAFNLRSPNHLLGTFPGCDGLKTGYIVAGGFSMIATAQRNGHRVVAVVLGSKDKKVRDAKAAELLSKGFVALESPTGAPPATTTNAPSATTPARHRPVRHH